MSKPTRTECFLLIGKLNAMKHLCEEAEANPFTYMSAAPVMKEIIEECQQRLEQLAPPKFTKQEIQSTISST